MVRRETPDEAERIRILCVDDHALVREGIGLIIDQQSDMTVVGSADSVATALTLFRQHKPDITLMDLRLGAEDGTQAIRSICQIDPRARVIALTVHQGDEDVYQAMAAGAVTYLLKDTVAKDLIRTIREVHSGNRPMQERVESQLARRAATRPLTARELQVLRLVSEGLRNREVAVSLGITEETIQIHVSHILEKLGVNDRTAAVTEGLRRGIIRLP